MDEIFNILDSGNADLTDIKLKIPETNKKKKVKLKEVNIVDKNNNKDDYIEAPHPHLMKPPFSCLVVAKKGSGKTVLTINMLYFYYKLFDNFFIFSPTILMDKKWMKVIEELNIPKENLFASYSEGILAGLLSKIKNHNSNVEQKEKIRCLFIFDDVIDQLPMTRSNMMTRLAQNHRHFFISHIIISQTYKRLHQALRVNTTGIILFNTDNRGERFRIIEELSGNYHYREFEKLYLDTVCKKKFNFMFINYDNRKIYENFEKQIGDLDRKPKYLDYKVERLNRKNKNSKDEDEDENYI